MFRRSKSDKVPPDNGITNRTKSDDNLVSRSKTISKIFTNTSNLQPSFQKHLKHLDFNDKENKTMATNNIDIKSTLKNINCTTSAPFEYGCLFWEIEWNAIEIELKTKTNGVIRSVPIEVAGHSWFVELYPRINNQENIRTTSNVHDELTTPNINHKKKHNNTPNVHNCKFNIFVKSNQTPIYCKFAVYYSKQIKNENISWKSIYCPNILLFKKNGSGFDKIVNFSDLCSLCVKKKLRLKIEFQVFDSVITKTVQNKQTKITKNIENKINKKNKETRKIKCKKLFENVKFSDVLLICSEKQFAVHACVLSSFSPKFDILLSEENKSEENKTENENNKYTIDLGSNWNANILQALLTFMYTDQLVDDIDLFQLIQIADEFKMETLIVVSLYKLSTTINTLQSNIIQILLWTQKYNHIEEIKEIENNCLKYIASNLNQLISNKQFQSFGNKNPQIFQKLLRFMATND